MHCFNGLGVLYALLLHLNLLFGLWNLNLSLHWIQTGPIDHEWRDLLILTNQRILVLDDDWSGWHLGLDTSLGLLLTWWQNAVLIFPLLAGRDGIVDLGFVRVTLSLSRVALSRICQIKFLLDHLFGIFLA